MALVMFIAAGLCWSYFSTIYAAIPVLVAGIIVGGYIYGKAEGSRNRNTDKDTQ